MANTDPKLPTTANGQGDLVAPTQEQRRIQRDRIVTSRLEILWEYALEWPHSAAKFRNAIETCLDVDEDFNRAALRRSLE